MLGDRGRTGEQQCGVVGRVQEFRGDGSAQLGDESSSAMCARLVDIPCSNSARSTSSDRPRLREPGYPVPR